jgi:Acetyltransferases
MLPENRQKKRAEIIRQMEIDDVSAVYHLGEKLFTSEELPILYRTWEAHEVTDYFSSDSEYCLVAEVEGEIAGFVLANTIVKEGTAWKRYGYLAWIGVDESYQRTGLGERLYRKLEDKFQEEGVRMIICDTEASNKGAIIFFERLGFSNRTDHIWLAKNLGRAAKKTGKQD